MWNLKKKIKMNLFTTKQRLTDIENTYGYNSRKRKGRLDKLDNIYIHIKPWKSPSITCAISY